MDPGVYTFYNETVGQYLACRGRQLIFSSKPFLWTLKPAKEAGFYFQAQGTDLLLDIDNAYVAPGTSVKVWEYTGYDVQIWTLGQNPNGSHSILYSGNRRYCLGFEGEKAVLQPRGKRCPMQEWTAVRAGTLPQEYLSFVSKGKTVELRLPLDITGVISRERLQHWADKLETAYASFGELTGVTPFENIVVEGCKPAGKTGFAGWVYPNSNVIHIDRDFLRQDLQKMSARVSDWNFCALHEMGHMFDFGKPWNFEPELMTDLKVAYVMEKTGAAAAPAEFGASTKFYGADIAKAYAALSSELSVRYDVFACAKRFLEIKERVGWEPFRKTFHSLQHRSGAYTGASGQEKLELFVRTLSHYSGENIQGYFSPAEWNAIIKKARS